MTEPFTREDVSCLLETIQRLAVSRDEQDVIHVIRGCARKLVNADAMTFILRRGDRVEYVDEDPIAPLWKGRTFAMDECVSGWVMRHHEKVAIEDVLDDPRVPADIYRPTFIKSLAIAPVNRREPVGAVGVYWGTRHAPTHKELELLQVIADAASTALSNIDLQRSQQRLVDQLNVFKAVIENSPDFVGIADAEGRPFYLNPAGRRMVRMPPGTAVNDTAIVDYYPEDQGPFVRDVILPSMMRDGSWTGETYFRDWQTGERIPVSDAHFAVKDPETGRLLGYATITRDSSGERRAANERELLLAHAQRSRSEAEEANRAKDEFLAMLGHELRNPLAPIVTALQLMRLRADGSPSREQEIIERQVRHLTGLVDDLLDIARITRGRIDLKREPVELSAIVGRAVEIVSPLLEQRRHNLTLDVAAAGLRTLGDPGRLTQVLVNLLTNAARYTESGGHLTVRARREGDTLLLSVQDTGIGILPEVLPQVFDVFFQGARSGERVREGLGLGLALVRRLVELHGGQVRARSEGPGHGSTFEVLLPVLTDDRHAQRDDLVPRRATPVPTRAVPLLVVDDNQDAADMLAELLRASGYDVRVAYDGPAALDVVDGFKPAIAILDIGLPVMDGYELGGKLRTVSPDIKLVALTGYGQASDRARSRASGFSEHLVKPIDPEGLLAAVARVAG